jgi:hypothetical protein
LSAESGESADNDVQDNKSLGVIGGCAFNEDVLGGELDLGVVTVDDRRKGKDDTIGVSDDGIDGGVLDDVEVVFQFIVVLIEFHQFLSSHLFSLIKRLELDFLGRKSIVGEGTLNGVVIVGTDGD